MTQYGLGWQGRVVQRSCNSAHPNPPGHSVLEQVGSGVRTHSSTPRNGRHLFGWKQDCLPQKVSLPSGTPGKRVRIAVSRPNLEGSMMLLVSSECA